MNDITDITWISIFGRASTENSIIKYYPDTYVDPKTNNVLNHISLLSSNVYFENGDINYEVKLEDFDARCEVVLKQKDSAEIHIGIANETFNISILKDGKWEFLLNVGNIREFYT